MSTPMPRRSSWIKPPPFKIHCSAMALASWLGPWPMLAPMPRAPPAPRTRPCSCARVLPARPCACWNPTRTAPLLNPCCAYARAPPSVHVPRPCRAHAAPMPALAVFHALAGILTSRTAIPLLVLHRSSALLLYARLLHALLFLLTRLGT